MKKAILFILMAFVLLIVTACGEGGDTIAQSSEDSIEELEEQNERDEEAEESAEEEPAEAIRLLSEEEVVELLLTAETTVYGEFENNIIRDETGIPTHPHEYESSYEELSLSFGDYFTKEYEERMFLHYYNDPESYSSFPYYFPMLSEMGGVVEMEVNADETEIKISLERNIFMQDELIIYTIILTEQGWRISDIGLEEVVSESAADEWAGVYVVDNPNLRGELIIYDETESGFLFDVEVAYTHVASYDYAAATKADANYGETTADDTGCWFSLEKDGDTITLMGNDCFYYAGAGIDFNHSFTRE
ncbi:hypothetical protein [Evansella tamaricis]|uniref:Uncharacterized protein n=1 Tax=Evansella tamaricis TaxID=2069301 RepID=A0ABS6JE76_9BACI|nr:hypothetical protein [Evansella tamaricis]MBU9711977.1 hypothetical protein [Evansella tamaricis]